MRVSDDEPGTIEFSVYESLLRPESLWLHEVYANDAALDVHRSGALHQTLKENGRLTGGPQLAHLLAMPPQNRFLINRGGGCQWAI